MTWYSHKVTGFALMYSLTQSLPLAIATALCSHLPDWFEFISFKMIPHRSITHYPWLYIGLLYYIQQTTIQNQLVCWGLIAVLSGCLVHVFQDFLSVSGVPLVNPFGATTGLGLYKTRSLSEFLVLVVILASFAGIFLFTDLVPITHVFRSFPCFQFPRQMFSMSASF